MWSVMCLPAWGGKPGLLLNLLGMAWGRATWGSRHTDPRDCRLGTNNRPPQKHRLDQLHSRAAGRAMSPITLPVPWPLLAQNSWAFPLQDQSLVALRRAGGAGDPQLGGDPVSAGLLGAGLLLFWKGVKSTHTVQPGLIMGLGHHCLGGGTTGATGGDWIRATAQGGDRYFNQAP